MTYLLSVSVSQNSQVAVQLGTHCTSYWKRCERKEHQGKCKKATIMNNFYKPGTVPYIYFKV